MRRLVTSLLALAALTAPAFAQKDELTIGITALPSTFHPSFDPLLTKTYILSMTRRPVTGYDKDWKLICFLCTELPTLENSKAVPENLPDGKKGVAVTYTLHAGATWGDGTPVSTDDVLFTWEVGKHPKSGVPGKELYDRIVKIDVKDRKTFTLHFDKLTYTYNAINDFELLPAHLDRANFADPENYQRRSKYDTDTTNPGLYHGPYRITQVAVGSHVVLEPNPHWYGTKPYFKRIVVRGIENSAALEANLLSGTVDYVAGEVGFQLDQAIAFEKRHGARFDIQYKPSLIYSHIDLNLDNAILKDKRVRQALLYGLDRETISRQLFEGKQAVAHSWVNPLDWVADDTLPKYAYDAAKAAKLLDEAGWSVMRGGFRHNDKGERLSFDLMGTTGNRTGELVQQVMQSQWRRLGIDVRIKNEPARVFFGETVRKRKFPHMAVFAWVSSPENVPRTILHSSHIPTAENNWAGQNDTGFRNAEVDDLIDRMEVELDRERRRAMWHRLQEIYIEELPVLPLYFRSDPFVVPKWLTGITPTGHQDVSTLWVETWRAK